MKRRSTSSYGFARASYVPRIIGLSLGFVSIASVFATRQTTPWWLWTGLAVHALAWPHLAWLWVRHSPDGVRAERRNLLIDHLFGGVWISAMAFNALPSVLMVALMSMDSMIAGGWRQFVRGMVAHVGGIAVGLLLFGLHWQPESSLLHVMACLPVLLFHPIAVGQITYRALIKLRRQREEMTHLSQHDGLTGILNRRHWEHVVKTEFARCRRSGETATLVLVDLDHFKRVNDTLGHAAGDAALRGFAQRLKDSLRVTDTPGRYGGEEFGILLPDTALRDASELMQRLQASLSAEPLLQQRVVTASFGVAALTADLPNHEAWMRLADQMLYRAKDRGRDCVITAGDSRPSPLAPADAQQRRMRDDAYFTKRVLAGLSLGDIGAVLFDPSDRLAWANPVFLQLFAMPPEARSFADMMRHCHRQRIGPRFDAEDIEVWLTAADAKRRSQSRRSFTVDMVDGRYFRVEEMSFDDGWLLDIFTEISAEQAAVASPMPTPASPLPDLPAAPVPRDAD